MNRLCAFSIMVWCTAFSASASELESFLLFQGLPDRATVFIDGKQIAAEQMPRIPVAAGTVSIRIDLDRSPVFKTALTTGPGETSTLFFNSSDDRATLDILTEPGGARVYINGTCQGQTPFLTSFLAPGRHRIKVELPGYSPRDTLVALSSGESGNLTLELDRSRQWRDSVFAVAQARLRRRQTIRKVAFTALAAALGGAGAWYDFSMGRALDRAAKASAAYGAATSDFGPYKDQYTMQCTQALDAMIRRNALYTASGAAALGLCLSFMF
jgi:hypothetical protein